MTSSESVSTCFDAPSPLPYQLPDFAQIAGGSQPGETLDPNAVIPAFQTALDDHAAEIAAIATNPEPPTWENTVEALETCGQMLGRVLAIVFNYSGVLFTDTIRDIELTVSPALSRHTSDMLLNRDLWQRLEAIEEQPEGSEEAALLKYWRRRFIRGGAELDDAGRERLRDIDAALATATTEFGARLQEATEAAAVVFHDEAELAGLSEEEKTYAAQLATEAGHEGAWMIRLGLPAVQPVLESLTSPTARQKVHEASLNRAQGATDELILSIAALRAERAQLLGFAHHADYVISAETAGSVSAVEELLNQVTAPAVANAEGEYKRAADLRAVTTAAGDADAATDTDTDTDTAPLSAADWPHWAAALRAEELGADDAEMKKYFPLDRVLVDGAFYAAKRLYGIDVTPRPDLQGYHPDVQVWEVTEPDSSDPTGETQIGIGLLLTDMYARPTKRGGAWMSSFVEQSNLLGTAPVVMNVMNIAKPAPGEQALLSLDEVLTVFHEFGHGLHGLLSDVRYPSLSGTNVPRDFVEFPSQINENWALEPAVLRHYARHVDTGEELPQELIDAVQEQAKWGQGYATTEYVAACWLDLAWHTLTPEQVAAIENVEAFETEALRRAGVDLDGRIAPRYRSTFFNHIFGGGYSADYWSYLWAEVLDADGFEAFIDTGAAQGAQRSEDAEDSSASTTGYRVAEPHSDDVAFAGERFRRMILSRGATIDYDDAFWMFRGKQRSVEPLLRRRGLQGAQG